MPTPRPDSFRTTPLKRNPRNGCWSVVVEGGPHGKKQWLSTGERDRFRASTLVREIGAEKVMDMAARGISVQQAVVAALSVTPITVDDLIAQWRETADMQLSPGTVRVYHCIMRKFANDNACGRWTIDTVRPEVLNAFINDPSRKLNSLLLRKKAMRCLFGYAVSTGRMTTNIVDSLQVRRRDMTLDRIEPTAPEPMTEDEYRKIVANTDGFTRWATILSWWTGLRMVDICCLERASIREKSIVLWQRKTGDRLEVPLDDPLIGGQDLLVALEEIKLQCGQNTYCFKTQSLARHDAHFREREREEFSKAARALGIDKTFNSIRHAFKRRLAADGRTLETIAARMGHASVETTKIYGRTNLTAPASSPTPSGGEVIQGSA